MKHVHHWKIIDTKTYILTHKAVSCEVCHQTALMHCAVELFEPIRDEEGITISCDDMAECLARNNAEATS